MDGLCVEKRGQLLTSREIDGMMHEILEELFDKEDALFPPDIKTKKNLVESYHCYRSFRQASNTRAMEKKVAITDIDTVDQWGKEECSKDQGIVQMPMRQHYTQPE